MKRWIRILSLFLAIALLTACTAQFTPQENISLNYNNTSAGMVDYWIENDAVYYLNATFGYTMKTQQEEYILSEELIGDLFYLQPYEDNVYYAVWSDEETMDPLYDVYQYQKKSGREIFITQVKDLEYLYADDTYLYIVRDQTYFDETEYAVEIYNIESAALVETIQHVYTGGMRNGNFTYLVTTEEGFEVHQWCPKTMALSLVTTVKVPITEDYTIFYLVNFTSKFMTLQGYNSKTLQHEFLIYSFANKELVTYQFDYSPEDFIAFETCAFFTLCTEEGDFYELHHINLESEETTYLGKIKTDKRLFVTSDEDVYLCNVWSKEIIHYNLNGTREAVLVEVHE